MAESEILVSFNNTYQSPGFPALGVLNAQTLEINIVDLPANIPLTGMLGLAVSSRYVFAGLQYAYDATTSYRSPPEIGLEYSADGLLASLNPCSLLIFDRNNFKLMSQYIFKGVRDVHSFLLSVDERVLYVVSTGTDEIIELELDGSQIKNENVVWRPEPDGERADHHHLNSICYWNGDIIVSGFGKKEIPDDWNSAQNGFIYNITLEQKLAEGLHQPHSLAVINGNLAYCESKEKNVRFIDSDKVIHAGGYSRGLCSIDNAIFIGTSAKRQKSKSTGKTTSNTERQQVGCTILKVSAVDPDKREIIELEDVAHEIYEFLPIENIHSWPFKAPLNYKEKFRHAWVNQINLAVKEIQEIFVTGSTLIIVDDNALGIQQSSFPHSTVLSFIEQEGIYWGPPQNDSEAISEIERLLGTHKPLSIVFLWPSFWWLETYVELNSYLQSRFNCVLKNERLIMFTGDQ